RPCAPDYRNTSMPSFDAVSELDGHELTNAVDKANGELTQRFDFKDTGATFTLKEKEFTVSMKAPAEFQLRQMLDILTQRLGKRGIEARCMEKKDPVTNLAEARQDIVLRHGIDQDTGKKLQKILNDSKLKVQAKIQDAEISVTAPQRATGKQRDDLQAAMALLRKAEVDRPLQFKNFRDQAVAAALMATVNRATVRMRYGGLQR